MTPTRWRETWWSSNCDQTHFIPVRLFLWTPLRRRARLRLVGTVRQHPALEAEPVVRALGAVLLAEGLAVASDRDRGRRAWCASPRLPFLWKPY